MTHPHPYFSFIVFWMKWNPIHAIEGYCFIYVFLFRFLTDFSVRAMRAVILFPPLILVLYRSKSHAPTDIGGSFFMYLSFVRN